MLKKIASGIFATGLLFSYGGQTLAAEIPDFKIDTPGTGNLENEDDLHAYSFTATKDGVMKIDFEDLEADGDVLKVSVREGKDVIWSKLADLEGESFKVKKGKKYKVTVGVKEVDPDRAEFNGAEYKLMVHGIYKN
ncbi:hypothetical protein CN354_28865 [Bacillus cereus]|nr:hypothetical protein CN354_28865 [Bacillus cereus]